MPHVEESCTEQGAGGETATWDFSISHFSNYPAVRFTVFTSYFYVGFNLRQACIS